MSTSTHPLTRSLRVAMMFVCLSVACGNSLAAWLNCRATAIVALMPTEESPAEETPAETQLPTELIELDEFTTHSSIQSSRRKTEPSRYFALATKCQADSKNCFRLAISKKQWLRNGCGANLRC